MSGSGQLAFPNIWEWSGVPSRSTGVVGSPSQKSGRQSQLFRNGGRPFRMSGSDRDAPLDVREWTGGPPGCQGVVGRSSWMSDSGREALPNVRE